MGPRIVVVEDENSVQELLCDILRDDGFSVECIARASALHALQDGIPPDLILIDLMLPGMSGIALAGDLRSGDLAHCPLIAISASRIMLHMAAESALFQATIAKPFDVTSLLDLVNHYAGRYVTASPVTRGVAAAQHA